MKPARKRYTDDQIDQLTVEQLEAMIEFYQHEPWELIEAILGEL